MDAFVSINAGTVSPAEFFDPAEPRPAARSSQPQRLAQERYSGFSKSNRAPAFHSERWLP